MPWWIFAFVSAIAAAATAVLAKIGVERVPSNLATAVRTLIVLAVGMVPVRFGYIFATYDWLGADAIWTSFPVTSFINLALAVAFYVHGGWKKARMSVDEPDIDECTEEALATREPGGALNPAG